MFLTWNVEFTLVVRHNYQYAIIQEENIKYQTSEIHPCSTSNH